MNRSHVIFALVISTALAACGAQTKNDATAQKQAVPPAHEATRAKGSAGAVAQNATAGEVILTGTTGCGHCNFHKTEACAVGLQTADGHFYVVDGVGEDTEVWNQRFAGKKMTVKGAAVPKGKDGLDHVQMASYEWVE